METYKSRNVILIDATSLFDQYSSRGIGRYTKSLLKNLIKDIVEEAGWDVKLFGFNELRQNLIEIGFSQFAIDELAPNIEFYSLGEPELSSLGNIKKWRNIDKIIDEAEPQIYFAPHFERGLPSTPKLMHSYKKVKTVVTQHDVIPLIHNSFSQKSPVHNFAKKLFYKFMIQGVKKANLVLTPSEFTKKDVINHLEIKPDKIKTIYLGVDEIFFKENQKFEKSDLNEILQRLGLTEKMYLFYDSGLEANKGIDNLIESLKIFFEQENKNLPKKLVITGGDFYKGTGFEIKSKTERGQEFLNKVKKEGILDKIVTTGKITDTELAMLLSVSSAYIYLSEYEGFGFGPLQAMASHVPSVVSNLSCLPEITDGGSILVDPRVHNDVSQNLTEIITNKRKRGQLVKKAAEIVKKYDWKDTASKTWEEIKQLVEEY